MYLGLSYDSLGLMPHLQAHTHPSLKHTLIFRRTHRTACASAKEWPQTGRSIAIPPIRGKRPKDQESRELVTPDRQAMTTRAIWGLALHNLKQGTGRVTSMHCRSAVVWRSKPCGELTNIVAAN